MSPSTVVSLPSAAPPRNYLERALWDQHNVIMMLGAGAFSLALASFVPLAVGAFAELSWLAIVPKLPAFRSWVDQRDAAAQREREEADLAGRPALVDDGFRARFAAVSRGAEEVRELTTRLAESPQQLGATERGLWRLRSTFLDYGEAHQRISRLLSEMPAAEWTEELSELQRRFASERDLEARMGLRNATQSLQRALAVREQHLAQLRNTESKLDTLQKSVGFLKALALNSGSVGQLAHELESLLAEVGPVPHPDAAPESTGAASATGGWSPSSKR